MAVACLKTHNNNMNSGHLQSQLTRSLERILEDANLSGELKLSGRKLKDFPKAAGKFNLSDTVIADLSRNRFCELPEDVTSLAFLERLLVFHNTIRSIPDTIRGLHSLTYLDLRNNQLSVLPREICFIPLQVLLVSNNRLVALPEELGRMDELTELDAACNQITHLPARMGDLRSLRSLSLRNNQLVYLPRELTCLQLVFLDVSCNKIATLPVELRLMSSLVDLELSNNPLTSPPASLCVRGLVHVFKYLETAAAKEEKSKNGGDGNTTLRRTITSKHSTTSLLDNHKNRRHHVDSGYSTSDGLDKRWSQELVQETNSPKWSPTPLHIRTDSYLIKSGNSTPSTISPGGNGNVSESHVMEDEMKKANQLQDQLERKQSSISMSLNNSTDISPEGDITPDSVKSDDKNRTLGNIQTYREYKEALRQQRSQDSTAIYRSKDALTPDSGGSITDSPLSNFSSFNKSSTSSPSVYSSSNQSSPVSPHHSIHKLNQMNANQNGHSPNGANTSPLMSPNRNVNPFDESFTSTNSKRPVQKVIPSRNTTTTYQNQSPTHLNGNHHPTTNGVTNGNNKIPPPNDYAYVKPNSPMKSTGILTHNNVPSSQKSNGSCSPSNGALHKPMAPSVSYANNVKTGQKMNKSVSWNRDVPAEKLSFTMRREFDKQKEETELIQQLRSILETRLKMTLPEEIAPSLTDGVVLCHLANYVRPRSVGSIHVPSPAVPKLTMARCRRNVDNFLDACRKIGVDEELICSCTDIVPAHNEKDVNDDNDGNECVLPPNESAMYQTIAALLNYKPVKVVVEEQPPTEASSTSAATNTITSDLQEMIDYDNEQYDNYFKSNGIYFQKMAVIDNNNIENAFILNATTNTPNNNIDDDEFKIDSRNIPISLDLSSTMKRKRKFPSTKYAKNGGDLCSNLNEIIEECEYDSDIGKFKCKQDSLYTDSETTSVDSITFTPTNNEKINDLNSPVRRISNALLESELNINSSERNSKKIVMKRIEFFENNSNSNEKIVNILSKDKEEKIVKVDEAEAVTTNNTIAEKYNVVSTILCLGAFILTILILIIHPLPN